MWGSLAYWCDPSGEVDGHPPRAELHFNIWCDLPGDAPDVLDVGILLKDARTFSGVYLYIPAEVPAESVEDLSSILEDTKTLSAVFNDTLVVGDISDNSFEAKKDGAVKLHVIKLNEFSKYTNLKYIEEEQNRVGTVIEFKKTIFEKSTLIGNYYIRIRIKLDQQLASLFKNEIVPSDRIFTSSFYRTEMIEFRINEKRNYSEALIKKYPRMRTPYIDAIHYFLVRNLKVELVQSHANFRKVRRLEPKLWDRYLQPFGHVSPEDMVIYHWRESVGESERNVQPTGVEDFVALTTFRTSRRNILFFLVVIVFLGAAGSPHANTIIDSIL